MFTLALMLAQAAPPPIRTTIPAPAPTVRQLPPVTGEHGETFFVESVGNWAIRVDQTIGFGCYGVIHYSDGTFMRIIAQPAEGEITISLANMRWRSLEVGKTQALAISLDQLEPWAGDALIGAFSPTLKSLSLNVGGDFLTEFGQARWLRADANGRMIARLDLTGSAGMLSALNRCQSEVENIVDDPFN